MNKKALRETLVLKLFSNGKRSAETFEELFKRFQPNFLTPLSEIFGIFYRIIIDRFASHHFFIPQYQRAVALPFAFADASLIVSKSQGTSETGSC